MIKEFKKNLAYNISIFAIVFGSTFGNFNAANAGAVNQGATAVTTHADADTTTFTATTAQSDLAAADQATNMINTDGQDTTYTLTGGLFLMQLSRKVYVQGPFMNLVYGEATRLSILLSLFKKAMGLILLPAYQKTGMEKEQGHTQVTEIFRVWRVANLLLVNLKIRCLISFQFLVHWHP